ncbi:MAG: carbohydrate-binding domain-containing protein [Solobacterium sp.]|nr:carbohydrate-binding domain-containing protein [Solobacterium sp.]
MKEKKFTAAAAALITACALYGCSAGSASVRASAETEQTAAAENTAVTSAEAEAAAVSYNTSGTSEIPDTSGTFTERDLRQTADLSSAVSYTVSDGSTIRITDEGVYVISGTAENCTIEVEADDSDKVQLVLDGVEITNDDSPAIYVISADKVFVTTTATDNTLSVTGTFTADGSTNTDAVIFSKDDLVLNGTGTLTIVSSDNGVSCKDDLKITGGTYKITSENDAFEANDSISVADGTIIINSGKDGFNSGDDDDLTVGSVYIAGGDFTINAEDDGIQGATVLQIDGGTFKIDAAEALEATYVQINGGVIDINASDDGINASSKSTGYDTVIEINDGTITITMAGGDTDAIDSNGSILINGGYIDITAQSPFDYDRNGQISGGTVIVNGTQISQMTNSMMGGGMMHGGMQNGFPAEGGQGPMHGEAQNGFPADGGHGPMHGGMHGEQDPLQSGTPETY